MLGLFSGVRKKSSKIVGLALPSEDSSDSDANADSGRRGPDDADDSDNKYRKRNPERLSTWSALAILTYLAALFYFVIYMDQRLPRALTLRDAPHHPDRFVEERARASLKKLTSVGARPAGSYENEVLAADFLRRELASIRDRANPVHRVSVDVQKPRGSFNLGFVDGLTHHYRDIQNVIAKVESRRHGARDSLLVNCHFDSVPQSPGASDDAVSCAIMLEILEVVTRSDVPLKHNLVLLFNGAEENMLPASHGFITQHMWASEVRAFVNLEAAGSGGRELVFQTGPSHPWLLAAYAKVAPHPFASVIAQEIFQSNVIPSDTDFRIFRDHGHIPGLDLAYVKNGYVYHTKFDTEERIPKGSIQRAGDNVLAIVKYLTQESDALGHTEAISEGSLVFFDVLGLFMVHYEEAVGVVLNLSVVVAAVALTYGKAKSSFQFGVNTSVYVKQLGYTFFIQTVGCLASLVSVSLVAIILDALGKTMSWYSKPYLIVLLYVAPTVMSVTAVFRFALPRQKKFFQFNDGIWVIESIYFEVSKLVWTFHTLALTLLRVKSAFFCMLWVLFPMAGRYAMERIYDRSAVKRNPRDWKWLTLHLMSLAVPIVLNMYLINTTFSMFIPIMGRSGSTVNPDLIIGYKAAAMTLATMSFLCPLVMVINKPDNVITTLYFTTVITGIFVATTSLGFPYSMSPSNVAPHRSFFIHTAREFYSKGGQLVKEDSGYFMLNLDRNSPDILMDWVPELQSARQISDKQCEKYLNCGMPIYYPVAGLLRVNHWLEAEKPRIFHETGITLLQSEHPAADVVKMLFEVRGPDHVGVYFSPEAGVSVKTWSLADGEVFDGRIWKDGRPTYFVFHSTGLVPTPFQFWLELKVPRDYMAEHHDLLDMAVAGHILHGNGMKSASLKEMLARLPAWSYPVGWTASYKVYKF